jgi:hypothetical protein
MIACPERSQVSVMISLSRRSAARLAMLCLAVLVLFFLIETGLHSVHHLNDGNQAAPCQWPACGTGHPVTAHSQSTTVQSLLVATGLLVDTRSVAPRNSPLNARHERTPPRPH